MWTERCGELTRRTTEHLDLIRGLPVVLFGILVLGEVAFADAPQVTNVTASQRRDGTQIVDIWYTVTDTDSDSLWIGAAVSKNGGDWYGVTPSAMTLSGDVGGGIRPGANKHIANRLVDIHDARNIYRASDSLKQPRLQPDRKV